MKPVLLVYPDSLRACVCCPRNCGADRVAGELGWCQTGAGFEIGSICRHRGEEPVLGGEQGVCNVFFTHCNLQCRYCQNHQISRNRGPRVGRSLTLDETVSRIERILDRGVRAVGFVSPSHVLPQTAAIIDALRARGRRPVVIYNSNGYDKVESLAALADRIDVYLPDLKYLDPRLAERYSDASAYPQAATAALKEMFRQKGARLELDGEGLIRSGLIVRHLVLPGQVENSKRVLRWIAEELSPEVTISLMSQYAPVPDVAGDPELGRPLRVEEYEEVLAELDRLGLENGWVQKLESRDYYNPDFGKEHPFE
jgi:putative pyruvate formate lyase activating enzyme